MNGCNGFHKISCKYCDETVYIPNWFDLENAQDLIGRDITEEQFKEFIKYNNEGIADKVSNLIRQELVDYFG